MDAEHARPEGVPDDAVRAAGTLSEALEYLERARGHLYSFHQLIGRADLLLDDVVEALRAIDRDDLAERVDGELLGLNVLDGRWTFQVVEEFDDGYYARFRELERAVRDELVAGRRHVLEAELKQRRRSTGIPGHEATPPSRG